MQHICRKEIPKTLDSYQTRSLNQIEKPIQTRLHGFLKVKASPDNNEIDQKLLLDFFRLHG